MPTVAAGNDDHLAAGHRTRQPNACGVGVHPGLEETNPICTGHQLLQQLGHLYLQRACHGEQHPFCELPTDGLVHFRIPIPQDDGAQGALGVEVPAIVGVPQMTSPAPSKEPRHDLCKRIRPPLGIGLRPPRDHPAGPFPQLPILRSERSALICVFPRCWQSHASLPILSQARLL